MGLTATTKLHFISLFYTSKLSYILSTGLLQKKCELWNRWHLHQHTKKMGMVTNLWQGPCLNLDHLSRIKIPPVSLLLIDLKVCGFDLSYPWVMSQLLLCLAQFRVDEDQFLLQWGVSSWSPRELHQEQCYLPRQVYFLS